MQRLHPEEQHWTLANSGAVTIRFSYTNAGVTVDALARVTSASSGSAGARQLVIAIASR